MTPAGFRHGLRVRIGTARVPGVLLRCEKRDGSGSYWRVRLQSGAWLWPSECGSLVVDGSGDAVATCQDCGLQFLTVDPTAPTCDRCQAEAFGTAADRVPDNPLYARADQRERRFRRGR
jgi:hypothetical protein